MSVSLSTKIGHGLKLPSKMLTSAKFVTAMALATGNFGYNSRIQRCRIVIVIARIL